MWSKSKLNRGLYTAAALFLLLSVAGCTGWTTSLVITPDGSEQTISRATLRALHEFATENKSVPLERVLYDNGCRVLENIQLTEPDGTDHIFDWAAVAETAYWHTNGTLTIGHDKLRAARLEATSVPALDSVAASLLDVAPTASAALGIPSPAQATGRPLTTESASHVLILFLDGFGYVRYTEARDAGLIPMLSTLGEPVMALTVYPPATAVASAALLTGAPPSVNGVTNRGIRTTDTETLFDVATQAGLRSSAVEGDALAFNMRNTDVTLSGDRDNNGTTNDNVEANALDAIRAGMPDLLWVHFHGIDDAGHTYGVDAPEERAAISEVDTAVSAILAALPPDTLVLIFADHGMHAVEEEGRLGNHGHLIARDMLVPLWIWTADGEF